MSRKLREPFEEFRLPPEKRPFPPRTLICSYDMFEYCKDRYSRREVHADRYCPNQEFCYFNYKSGGVRMVLDKKEIWICDADRGFPYRKRVR